MWASLWLCLLWCKIHTRSQQVFNFCEFSTFEPSQEIPSAQWGNLAMLHTDKGGSIPCESSSCIMSRIKCHTNTRHRHCHIAFECFMAASYIPWASEIGNKRLHCFLFISFHYKPGMETLDRNFSRKMLFVIKQGFQSKWRNQQNPSMNPSTIPTFSSSSLQQMTEHNS